MFKNQDTQVLIIGAGVIGLSASLFLAQHGIKSIPVERRGGTSVHLRARSVNQRTMELSHLEDQVHEAGKGIASSRGIFVGKALREVVEPRPRRDAERPSPLASIAKHFSPAQWTFVTQTCWS